MKCSDPERSELIDDYILGRLSEGERKAFELHYLGCDRCFQELAFRDNVVQTIRRKWATLRTEYLSEERIG